MGARHDRHGPGEAGVDHRATQLRSGLAATLTPDATIRLRTLRWIPALAASLLGATAGHAQQVAAPPISVLGLAFGAEYVHSTFQSPTFNPDRTISSSGTGATVTWGLTHQFALRAAYSRAPVELQSGDKYRVDHLELLLHYQAQQEIGGLRPYLEAGMTQRTMLAQPSPLNPNPDYKIVGWVPVVGVGARSSFTPSLSFTIGTRLTRGSYTHAVVNGEDQDINHPYVASLRSYAGMSWQGFGRPRSALATMQHYGRPVARTEGLGLSVASAYGDNDFSDITRAGPGSAFGASWGLTAQLSVVARYSKLRLRRGNSADVTHRELFGRYLFATQTRQLIPYVEGGMSRHSRAVPVAVPVPHDERVRGTNFGWGAGLLYYVQPTWSIDIGAAHVNGDFDDGGFGEMRTLRLMAGMSWHPAAR